MFKRFVYNEGLTSLTGSNGQYLINIMGQVKDRFGNNVQTSLDNEGHLIITVCGWNGLREYRVIDLVAIQFKSLKIPVADYCKIIAFVIDGNKNNTHAENIGYRFLNGKLEINGYPGFYYIPGITSVGINNNGILLYVKTGKFINWFITKPSVIKNSKGGYFTTNVLFSSGVTASVLRHRALCLVFKEYPDNADKMTINHIDGIPGNDFLDNLEWVTRGQNNLHAYVNDLKKQHKRILVRDVLTGNIEEYYSISECARVLGYSSEETIRQRLISSQFCKVFEDGKQFKLKDDIRDWMLPENPIQAIIDGATSKPIKSRNCKTMLETLHISVGAASRETNIKSATISWRLARNDQSPLFGHQFKLAKDNSPWPSFTITDLNESLMPTKFTVDCKNHFTGEELTFDSVNTAGQHVGNMHVAIVLRRGEQPLLSNGWQMKYAEDSWQTFDDVEKEIYLRTNDLSARNESTGEVIITESARQMGFLLKLDPKAIRLAALTRGNKLYHGYRFRLGVSDEPWPDTNININD